MQIANRIEIGRKVLLQVFHGTSEKQFKLHVEQLEP
jgi:hypothetical protein